MAPGCSAAGSTPCGSAAWAPRDEDKGSDDDDEPIAAAVARAASYDESAAAAARAAAGPGAAAAPEPEDAEADRGRVLVGATPALRSGEESALGTSERQPAARAGHAAAGIGRGKSCRQRVLQRDTGLTRSPL